MNDVTYYCWVRVRPLVPREVEHSRFDVFKTSLLDVASARRVQLVGSSKYDSSNHDYRVISPDVTYIMKNDILLDCMYYMKKLLTLVEYLVSRLSSS